MSQWFSFKLYKQKGSENTWYDILFSIATAVAQSVVLVNFSLSRERSRNCMNDDRHVAIPNSTDES